MGCKMSLMKGSCIYRKREDCSMYQLQEQKKSFSSLMQKGMETIKLHEQALLFRMLEGSQNVPGLRNIRGVKVFLDYPDLSKRDFIIAIELENWGYTEAVREYERRGCIVFERLNSSIYSKRMLESFGMTGCIRVSPLHCNNIEEIDEFLKMTVDMVEKKRIN